MWVALAGAIHVSSQATAAQDDADAIRALIGATWDRPDSKVETDPVVVSGQHAVASWTQGDRGGRALLKRDGAQWKVVLCSGDPLTRAGSLVEAGVPKPDADVIAQRLTDDEARASADRRAKFSLFEGTVMGDAPAHHPQHNQDHSPLYRPR
jgi:hypothetical protein